MHCGTVKPSVLRNSFVLNSGVRSFVQIVRKAPSECFDATGRIHTTCFVEVALTWVPLLRQQKALTEFFALLRSGTEGSITARTGICHLPFPFFKVKERGWPSWNGSPRCHPLFLAFKEINNGIAALQLLHPLLVWFSVYSGGGASCSTAPSPTKCCPVQHLGYLHTFPRYTTEYMPQNTTGLNSAPE